MEQYDLYGEIIDVDDLALTDTEEESEGEDLYLFTTEGELVRNDASSTFGRSKLSVSNFL